MAPGFFERRIRIVIARGLDRVKDVVGVILPHEIRDVDAEQFVGLHEGRRGLQPKYRMLLTRKNISATVRSDGGGAV